MSVSNRRRRQRHNGHTIKAEMNVVPLIDVMLVLLVIFMATAPMMKLGTVDLPKVGGGGDVPGIQPLIVYVQQDGAMRVQSNSDQPAAMVALNQLPAHIAQINAAANRPVLIAADKQVLYDHVMQVMNTLKQANVPNLGLLVDDSGNPAAP